tara:strand:+ start:1535 stop:1708 length:174 start_codon:yes stop_codon:yes gene_type:complete
MAKTMKVPVLVFEHQDDVELIIQGLERMFNQEKRDKIRELLEELYKTRKYYETVNNS